MKIDIYNFGSLTTGNFAPRPCDIVITGRCIDEFDIVIDFLENLVPYRVNVFTNPIMYEQRGDHTIDARVCSAVHKSERMLKMIKNGVGIRNVYEDDPLQMKIIKENLESAGFLDRVQEFVLVPKTVEF